MAEIIFKGIAHGGAFKDLFSKNIEDADILDVLTELGMVKSPVKSEQRAKALSPMEITELGILIDVSSETDLNASLPMAVTVLGITVLLHPVSNTLVLVSMMALQSFLESYMLFSGSTVTGHAVSGFIL